MPELALGPGKSAAATDTMHSNASCCMDARLQEEHLEYAVTDSNYLSFCCGDDFEIREPENCHTIFLILTGRHLASNREFITVVILELS